MKTCRMSRSTGSSRCPELAGNSQDDEASHEARNDRSSSAVVMSFEAAVVVSLGLTSSLVKLIYDISEAVSNPDKLLQDGGHDQFGKHGEAEEGRGQSGCEWSSSRGLLHSF